MEVIERGFDPKNREILLIAFKEEKEGKVKTTYEVIAKQKGFFFSSTNRLKAKSIYNQQLNSSQNQ